MKNSFTVLFFFLLAWRHEVACQDIGFLDSTFIWTENHQYCCAGSSQSFRYTIDSEPRLFSGKTYYAVLQSHVDNSENWGNTYNYIRFENNVVYQHLLPDEVELYNFNLMVGDTFQFSIGEVVDSIDTIVLLTGEVRKRWKLRCTDDDPETAIYSEWVEGIGNINGLFAVNSATNCTADGDGSDIMCMFRNDTLIYDDPQINGCWLLPTATHEVEKNEISMTPNPVVDFININGLPEEVLNIQIFNIMGNLVYQGISKTIDANEFSAGYYVLVCMNGHGNYLVKGFIKL